MDENQPITEVKEKIIPTNLGQLLSERRSEYGNGLIQHQSQPGYEADFTLLDELDLLSRQIYSLEITREQIMQERGAKMGKGEEGTIDTSTEYGLQGIADNTSLNDLLTRYHETIAEWDNRYNSEYSGKTLTREQVTDAAEELKAIKAGESLVKLISDYTAGADSQGK